MRLTLLVSAFVAGVVVGLWAEPGWTAVALMAGGAVLVAAALRRTGRGLLPALALLALAVGVGRVVVSGEADLIALVPYHGTGPVLVQGTVVGEPERAGRAFRLTVEVDSLDSGDGAESVTGKLLATVNLPTGPIPARVGLPYRRGDRVELLGRLSDPPGARELGFDYPSYLARQGIGSVMSFPSATVMAEGVSSGPSGWLSDARRGLARSIRLAEPEPQASVGTAMLLGVRDELEPALVEDFRRSGASHLLAISGLHVGVVLGLTLALSRAVLGRRRHIYLIAPLIVVWLYAALAGMSPTVTRAAIMGTVYLAALLAGRPGTALPALASAVGVMVGIDPAIIEDVGFQLSVTAVTGIALLARPLAGWWAGSLGLDADSVGPGPAFVRGVLGLTAVTVTATAATLPIVALHFEAVSLLGIPVTLLTLPALPFVLVGQALAAISGLTVLGWAAWLSTAYVTSVVEVFARLPGAGIQTGAVTPALVVGYYAVGLGVAFFARGRLRAYETSAAGRPFRLHGSRSWALGALLVASALLWAAAAGQPDGRLHVVFADVGQGDAIYIETPGGGRILVDGGPDPLDAVRLLGEREGPGDRSVDLVVLTHPHADHIGGLIEVLDRYDVLNILERRMDLDGPLYGAWRRAVDEEGARAISGVAGTNLTVDGLLIEVLGPSVDQPSDVNDASVVLKLTYGEVSFLLVGDAFATAERALVRSGTDLTADVLKVAHHGSRTSSSGVFLAAVDPAVALISVGEDNPFGHPHPSTLDALSRHVPGELIFRTDRDGTVEMTTDGRRLWVVR